MGTTAAGSSTFDESHVCEYFSRCGSLRRITPMSLTRNESVAPCRFSVWSPPLPYMHEIFYPLHHDVPATRSGVPRSAGARGRANGRQTGESLLALRTVSGPGTTGVVSTRFCVVGDNT